MAYNTPYNFNPQFYFYFLPNPTTSPRIYFPENTQIEKNDKMPKKDLPVENVDKIILTSQDLIKKVEENTKRPWTQDQDKILMKLCRNEDIRFEQIATNIQGRNAKMCYSRYRRLMSVTKQCWSKEQDKKLIALVEIQGTEDWRSIAQNFPRRNYKQVKDHYINYLRPELSKEEWSIQEDLKLISFVNMYGKNWKKIEEELMGRSRNQIKNRFFGKIKRLNDKKLKELQQKDQSSF